MPDNARTLVLRILSAAILWPGLGLALVYLPALGFGALAAGAIVVSFAEYLALLVFPRSKTIGLAALLIGCIDVAMVVGNSLELSLAVVLLGSLALLALSLAGSNPIDSSLFASALAITGFVYVMIPLTLIILLRYSAGGVELVGFLLVTTWGRDIGAFLVGHLVHWGNGHFIKPSVSPRKTYEGAIGGMIVSILTALAARNWLGPGSSLLDAVILGTLIGAVGQVGDLVESVIKRVRGVADSSRIIPGQGGMLDTLDSFIYTTPIFYLFASLRSLLI